MDIFLGIWAINHLFHTNIEYNFLNCIAAWIIVAIVDSDPLFKWERKKEEDEVRKMYKSDW
jgi:hypothetical protein